jgi:DNA-binding response OmpR family regulator
MKHVLIVEDSHIDAFLIQTFLSRLHFLSSVSTNLFQILQSVKKGHVDIITVDLQMPEIDGLYLAEHVRKIDKQIPIIIITCQTSEQVRMTCLQNGANYYIQKPFSRKDIESVFTQFK